MIVISHSSYYLTCNSNIWLSCSLLHETLSSLVFTNFPLNFLAALSRVTFVDSSSSAQPPNVESSSIFYTHTLPGGATQSCGFKCILCLCSRSVYSCLVPTGPIVGITKPISANLSSWSFLLHHILLHLLFLYLWQLILLIVLAQSLSDIFDPFLSLTTSNLPKKVLSTPAFKIFQELNCSSPSPLSLP